MIELHADFTVQGSGLTINPQWSLLLQSLMEIFCVYIVGRVSWKSSALTARVVEVLKLLFMTKKQQKKYKKTLKENSDGHVVWIMPMHITI